MPSAGTFQSQNRPQAEEQVRKATGKLKSQLISRQERQEKEGIHVLFQVTGRPWRFFFFRHCFDSTALLFTSPAIEPTAFLYYVECHEQPSAA